MTPSKTMMLLALGLSISACGTENRGLESVHQPVVERSDYAFDVYGGPDGLAPQDESRVRGWFDSMQLSYGDKVSVDMAGAYGSTQARRDIAQIAASYGILLQEGAPATGGTIAPGTVRVIVSRLKASVPGCPDWSRTSGINFNNHAVSNYGCAINGNMAAMIADPEDLVRGKTGNIQVDSDLAGKAIKAYREADPTGKKGLKIEKTSGSGGQN